MFIFLGEATSTGRTERGASPSTLARQEGGNAWKTTVLHFISGHSLGGDKTVFSPGVAGKEEIAARRKLLTHEAGL